MKCNPCRYGCQCFFKYNAKFSWP